MDALWMSTRNAKEASLGFFNATEEQQVDSAIRCTGGGYAEHQGSPPATRAAASAPSGLPSDARHVAPPRPAPARPREPRPRVRDPLPRPRPLPNRPPASSPLPSPLCREARSIPAASKAAWAPFTVASVGKRSIRIKRGGGRGAQGVREHMQEKCVCVCAGGGMGASEHSVRGLGRLDDTTH
jgi:hypothetical protein